MFTFHVSRWMRMGFLLSMAALLATWVFVNPAQAAGMTVNPSYGNYDQSFDVSADGFNPKEQVSLWVGLSNGKTVSLGATQAASDGSIGFTVTPAAGWSAGEVIAVARGNSSKREYSVKFTLAKADNGSSASSSGTTSTNGGIIVPSVEGLTVTYQGTGYKPGERVSTWFQYPGQTGTSQPLPDVYADAAGNVSFAFTVQKNWTFGNYHITAEGAESKHVTYNTFSYFGTITDQRSYWASSGTVTNGAWVGQYFDNVDLSGSPVLTRSDANINFNWGTGSPASNIPSDNFSVRWDSTRTVSTAGNYTITATADDGIRVYVDGALAIDGWSDHPATTYTATVALGAGNHTFTVEYYERTLYASVAVSINAD